MFDAEVIKSTLHTKPMRDWKGWAGLDTARRVPWHKLPDMQPPHLAHKIILCLAMRYGAGDPAESNIFERTATYQTPYGNVTFTF